MRVRVASFRFRPAAALKTTILTILCIIFITYLFYSSTYESNATLQEDAQFTKDMKTLYSVNAIDNDGDGRDNVNDEIIVYPRNKVKKDENIASKNKWKILLDTDYQRRLSKAYDHCLTRPAGMAKRIIIDKRRTSALCIVPKVGCTHWINIFRFINNETDGVLYEKPSDIPRWVTHYSHYKTLDYTIVRRADKTKDGKYFSKLSFLGDAFRFMFVRHPIRRLLSAWLDKFLLPDFWFSDGPYVASYLKLPARDNVCPTNISFNQFLRFVTHPHFEKWPYDLNDHWKPLRYLCDPCVFKPHLIGKMETFSQDVKTALSAMDVGPYLKEILEGSSSSSSSHDGGGNNNSSKTATPPKTSIPDTIWSSTPYYDDRAVHEMITLTTYTIDWMNAGRNPLYLKSCGISKIFVAQRLWQAFQYNGYIRSNIKFRMTQWDLAEWHKTILQAYSSSWYADKHSRQEQQRNQKETILKMQYKRIPLTTVLKLQSMFWSDYFQFGYDFVP